MNNFFIDSHTSRLEDLSQSLFDLDTDITDIINQNDPTEINEVLESLDCMRYEFNNKVIEFLIGIKEFKAELNEYFIEEIKCLKSDTNELPF